VAAARSWAVVLVPGIIGAAILGLLLLHQINNTTPATKPTPTTAATPTSPRPLESAAGKPCVATVDPLPAGAPPVDVEIGPASTTLVIKDLENDTGETVGTTGTVTVNYVGVACSTGKIFASSYQSGESTIIPLDEVISGWAKGVAGMKVGGRRLLGVPSDQAYGTLGAPPDVAPDEAVWFVVEVTAATP
jgi:peptidylprolyl isomerase